MTTLSGKLKNILFGSCSIAGDGLPLRAYMKIPLINGEIKKMYWEGNLGIITTLWNKIDKLEEKILELKSLKSNK